MCMEKKKLNEDPNGWITLLKILAPFVLSAILSGVRADFQQIISNVWRGKNKTEAEEFAQSIALELGYDKSFLQALAKFIIEAGGFKKFIEKVKTPRYDPDVFDWKDFDDEGFVNNMGRNATDIVKNLLALPVVKQKIQQSQFEDKRALTKAVGAQFYLFVTQKKLKQALIKQLDDMGEKLEDLGLSESKKISLRKLLPKK
jgi:hypothetical protein